MEEGKIYKAKCNVRNLKGHIHPIIILEIDKNSNSLIGAIISHEKEYGNKELSSNHFKNSNEYTVQFDVDEPSYLIYKKLIKIKADINVKAVGELTSEGLEYVKNMLKDVRPEVLNKPIWEE